MHVKKHKSKVYGASFTAAEKRAMELEIKRQIAEYEREHCKEVDAMILWALHEVFGFGPKRLRKFFDNFSETMERLHKWYEMDESDESWLCSYKLKSIGIDIEEWLSNNDKNS